MKTLIINGHPDQKSFTSQIARSIFKQLEGQNLEILNVSELNFNPVYLGFGDTQKLEEDIAISQQKIKDANHIIILTPIWWSTYPALLKGFFDRVLMPNFAFRYDEGQTLQTKLLTGKTAELILMSDAPAWYRKYILRDPAAKILKRDILGFCGIKVNKVRRVGNVRGLSQEERAKIIINLSK
jgi:putative NADPH-quinone reductase